MGYGSHCCLRLDFTVLGFQFFLLEVYLGHLGTDLGPFGVDFRHLEVILAFVRQFSASEVRFFASGSPVKVLRR